VKENINILRAVVSVIAILCLLVFTWTSNTLFLIKLLATDSLLRWSVEMLEWIILGQAEKLNDTKTIGRN
jgi:hypothetical protein